MTRTHEDRGDVARPAPADRGTALSGLARHSAIYTAAPLLRQVISVAMTNLYTGWLHAPGFGIKETVDFWMIGLQQLLGQNVLGGMVRFYFEHEDPRKRASVVTSSTIAITAFAWIVCGLGLVFHRSLRVAMLGHGGEGIGVGGDELDVIVALILVLVPFQLSSLSFFYYLQIQKRSTLYTTLQTGKFFFEIGMNFWLIGHLGLGVRGFLLSMLAGEALTSLLLTGGMLRRLRPRVDLAVLKPILGYAAPLVPVGLCQFALHQLDRVFLLRLSDPDPDVAQTAAGIYGLAYKIGQLVNAMLLGSFLQIWQPWIFAVRDAGERARLVARVSTYAVAVIAAATIVVVVLGRQAVALLAGAPEFLAGWRAVPLIGAGYVAWALYQVSQIPLFLAKRTGRILAVNVAALAVNAGLNLALVPRYGAFGAATATCATFACLAVLGMLASKSEAHVRFEVRRLLAVMALVALAVAGTYAVEILLVDRRGYGLPAALAVKAALLAPILAGVASVLRRDERAQLLGWIRRRGADPDAGSGGR